MIWFDTFNGTSGCTHQCRQVRTNETFAIMQRARPTKRPKSQKVGVAFDVPSDERFMVRACVLAECRFKPGPQTAQLKFCWSQLQGKALIIAHNVWARGAAMIPIRFWNPYTRPGCGYFRFDCTCPQECCWEGK